MQGKQRGNLSSPTSVRFFAADVPLLVELAKAKGFKGFAAMIRTATYLYAEQGLSSAARNAAGDAAGGVRLIWSFADIGAAERLAGQARRVGTLLNQAVRALNIIAAAIDEGGEPGDLLRLPLPHADDMRRLHDDMNKLTADLDGFIGVLRARIPDRKDGRRREARPRSATS